MSKKQIVIIFIRNRNGDFFVHQRLATKKTFPNLYGIGAGGHVEDGEETMTAATRELKEETGLTSGVEYLWAQDFDTSEDMWTSHLFITQSDDVIQTDETEWQWSGWMSKSEVDQLYSAGKLCTDTGAMYKKYIDTYN